MGKVICKNCGYKVKKNVKYCPECGVEIKGYEDLQNNVKSNNILETIKKIKKLYIIIAVIVITIIISVIAIFNNSYNIFIRNFKKDNIDAIQSNYENYSDKDIEKVYSYLSEQVIKIKDDYINDKMSYEDAKEQLDKIGKSCKKGNTLTDYVNCSSDVEKLHNSRDSFKKADDYYSKNNYEKAIENYQKVIESDSNYSEAQEKIQALKQNVAQDYYDKAKNSYDNEDYSAAVNYINNAIKYANNSDYQDMKQKCIAANDKAIADKEEAERQKKLLVSGKEISTTKFDIQYKGASFETRIMPDNTSGAYLYYNCPNDSIFVDIVFSVTNKSDYSSKIDLIKNFSATYGTKYYSGNAEYYSESGSTNISPVYSSTSITPLKTVTYHVTVKLPYEAVNTDESITVNFKIDGEEQILEFR